MPDNNARTSFIQGTRRQSAQTLVAYVNKLLGQSALRGCVTLDLVLDMDKVKGSFKTDEAVEQALESALNLTKRKPTDTALLCSVFAASNIQQALACKFFVIAGEIFVERKLFKSVTACVNAFIKHHPQAWALLVAESQRERHSYFAAQIYNIVAEESPPHFFSKKRFYYGQAIYYYAMCWEWRAVLGCVNRYFDFADRLPDMRETFGWRNPFYQIVLSVTGHLNLRETPIPQRRGLFLKAIFEYLCQSHHPVPAYFWSQASTYLDPPNFFYFILWMSDDFNERDYIRFFQDVLVSLRRNDIWERQWHVAKHRNCWTPLALLVDRLLDLWEEIAVSLRSQWIGCLYEIATHNKTSIWWSEITYENKVIDTPIRQWVVLCRKCSQKETDALTLYKFGMLMGFFQRSIPESKWPKLALQEGDQEAFLQIGLTPARI